MISYCPYCGHSLKKVLTGEGFSTCSHCNRLFDSCRKNRLLSAAWAVRKRHLFCLEQLEFYYKLEPDELKIIEKYIIEEGYSHDEFLKAIDLITAA